MLDNRDWDNRGCTVIYNYLPVQACFVQKKWTKLFKLMDHSLKSALKRLEGTLVKSWPAWPHLGKVLLFLQNIAMYVIHV